MRSSNRPGRSNAGSIRVGRLVAPITTTFCNSSRPSISARMVLTTRSVTCGSPRPPPGADPPAARRHQTVELVDEDDRRCDLAGAVEQPRDLLLALAIPFAEEI